MPLGSPLVRPKGRALGITALRTGRQVPAAWSRGAVSGLRLRVGARRNEGIAPRYNLAHVRRVSSRSPPSRRVAARSAVPEFRDSGAGDGDVDPASQLGYPERLYGVTNFRLVCRRGAASHKAMRLTVSSLLLVVTIRLLSACGGPGTVAVEKAKPDRNQCPKGTFVDNKATGAQSVQVNASADVLKRIGGAAVTYSGTGSARITCRQLCPSGLAPNVEESESAVSGSVFKFHCDPKDGKPGSDYIEVRKQGESPKGTVRADVTK